MELLRHRLAGFLMAALGSLAASGCVVGIVDLDESDGPWNKEATSVVHRTMPVSSQRGILVLGVNGNVCVLGVDGAMEVSIRATKRVLSNSIADAEAHLSDIKVRVLSTSNEIRVETDQPDESGNRTYAVDYEITVPADFSVVGVNGNGNMALEGVRSDADLKLANGNVTLERMVGSAWVALGNGNLRASMSLPDGGEIIFAVGNGTTVLTLQPDVSAELTARVGNGTISVSGLNLGNPVAGTNAFSATLGSGAGLIDLAVGNGHIQVKGS